MLARSVDVVVLGGGTGGYVAAIRAAQLGKQVVIVEKEKLGGTCLHRGCIPSKTLLRSAEVNRTIHESSTYGVLASPLGIDWKAVMARKQAVIEPLHRGIQTLMKQNKIEVVYGNGRIMGASIFSPRSGVVSVDRENGESDILIPGQLVIATGSRPRQVDALPIDGKVIVTSDEALEMDSLPESIVIVGGGVIGVEWASMMIDFGVNVTLVEMSDRLIPQEDVDISKRLRASLTSRGVTIYTSVAVEAATLEKNASNQSDFALLSLKSLNEETVPETIQASCVMVCVGRVPNVDGIGLENTDVKVERGAIVVNANQQTSETHIYAIGDVTGGMQLAHVASHQGMIAAEHGAGLKPIPMHELVVPRCVYSHPEIAAVGFTEVEAKKKKSTSTSYVFRCKRLVGHMFWVNRMVGSKQSSIKIVRN